MRLIGLNSDDIIRLQYMVFDGLYFPNRNFRINHLSTANRTLGCQNERRSERRKSFLKEKMSGFDLSQNCG